MSNTKVTIIGEQHVTKKLQKIKFIKVLDGSGEITDEANFPEPHQWKNIELISRKYTCHETKGKEKDLMFAYDINRTLGILYLGYFNDGVV